MKKLNKKGFTIVELVIVIAVIGILAAVLIPTFSGVIQKANQSSALQVATSTMKSTLAMSDYGTISDGTVFVVDSYDNNGYVFKYENNAIAAKEFAENIVTYNAENMNSIIVNKDLAGDTALTGKAKTIVDAAIGSDGWTYTKAASSTARYFATLTKGGNAAVTYAAGDTIYVKSTAPDYDGDTKLVKGTDFADTSTGEFTTPYTILEGDKAIIGEVKTPAVAGTTWYIFTNSDYATNVVTFMGSKVN